LPDPFLSIFELHMLFCGDTGIARVFRKHPNPYL
jgi:hypothetical protein